MKKTWLDSLNASITICNSKGIIVYMNKKSMESFSKYGGSDLLGKSLFNCHSDSSGKTIEDMIKNGTENIYTIEKEGKKSIIIQKPIYEKKELAGLMEVVIDLPTDIPHHRRD